MAILDTRTRFCEDLDLDAETGTILATSQIDLGAAGVDIGAGRQMYVHAVVTEAFTDGGDAATLDIRVVSDDSASIHATTSTVHVTSGAMLKAALTLGKHLVLALPQVGNTYERYLGINFVTATAGFDAGMITAWLSDDPTPSSPTKHYPDAVN
jgi:hypothetical protein